MKRLIRNSEDEARSHFRTINREMLIGWLIIVVVLLVTYIIEIVKGARSITYVAIFAPVLIIPLLCALIVYLRIPDWGGLCYIIVPGYFVMYLFVMITGSTPMVFSYILPLLSLLILYHHPNMILITGAAAVIINLISIILNSQGINYFSSQVGVNSKDAEIQIALIILCFGGCYFASRLYNSISKKNYDYIEALNEKTAQVQSM